MDFKHLRVVLPFLFLAALAAACGGSGRAGLGEACDGSTGVYQCKSGLVCAHDGNCQDPGSGVNGQASEGESCARTDDCDYGLVCGAASSCIPGGVAARDAACTKNEDCQYSLVCTAEYVCDWPGNGGEGQVCLGAQDCAAGLVCAGDLVCRDPDSPDAVGVAGPGDECGRSSDCRFGLVCFLDGACAAPELWGGADCSLSDAEEQDDGYPFKVYFEVPGQDQVAEFYRLPFPNDIRLVDGRVDLHGHPAPDTPLAEGLVGAYIEAIEAEADGFSTQGAIFLRFSKNPDYATIDMLGAEPNLYLVDITPDSPGYGVGWVVSMFSTFMRGKYICQNWLAVKPNDGFPLRHSTTYALIATEGIESRDGSAIERDGDFAAMLSTDAPSDAVLASAWGKYQPLRAYLADESVTDKVMAATVFTTMDPDAVMAGFRDKIRACAGPDCGLLPEPAPAGMELASQDESIYVLTGTLSVPVFQAGTPPYLAEGGGVDLDGAGAPVIQRAEDVAFTLTVPKAAPPPEGWPTVIYAHGTGGSSGSFVTLNVGAVLAGVEVTLDAGPQTVRFAVLGIDAVQHGDRRGGSDLGPDVLYFNFINPRAAKYNAVQGAADNFQLVRLIEHLNDSPLTVAGVNDPVRLDPGAIFYFGHSQGCLTGPLFLAFSPAVRTTVLSAAGGNLVRSLLTKTEPVDIAGATRLMLGDLDVGNLHPMLNLLQLYFDPIDTVNYGGALTLAPILDHPKHVLMSFGRDDAYSTEQTMISFARSMGLRQVDGESLDCQCRDKDCDSVGDDGLHESLCKIYGLRDAAAPVRANAYTNNVPYTSALKMYLPDGYDGHFVLFQHPEGPADYSRFLGSAVADPEGIPTLFP